MSEPSLFPISEPSVWPLVSAVIPCRNEARYIGSVIEGLLYQEYPGDVEVLVVDGMSEDGTREIAREWVDRDRRVSLIDNPDRNKPAALNRGIRASSGDVIVRIDAHAQYPADYLRACVENLVGTAADNVGGLRETLAGSDTILARAIALSISSRFGSGGAVYRSGAGGRRWVDTVFCGAYMRSTFDEIGLFDERLLRGQDREFNERLRRAGGRVLFVPEIRVRYFARNRLGSFARWIYDGGATPFMISRLAGYRIWSTRNLVPAALVAALVLPLVASLIVPNAWWLAAAAAATYAVIALVFAVLEAGRAGSPVLVGHLFVVFALTHLLYGVGSFAGSLLPLRKDWVRS